MNPTDWLRLGVEQYLRELPDDDLGELMHKVRPPDTQNVPKTGDAAFIEQLLGGRND